MTRNPRSRRTAKIAALLMTGAIVLQLGPLCSLAGSTALSALDLTGLLDSNGKFLGLFQLCSNTQSSTSIDVNGSTAGSTTTSLGGSGDLIYHCPVVTTTTVTTGTGG
jgi:hypothetical protein